MVVATKVAAMLHKLNTATHRKISRHRRRRRREKSQGASMASYVMKILARGW